jgi:hypothetical protein
VSARAVRLVAIVGLAIGLTIVPVRQVAACDCALTELPAAIQEAEVAIIGTLTGATAAGAEPGVIGGPTRYVWSVERARDPMSAVTIEIAAWPNDGANCGISFAPDERWLVLAYQGEGVLETNGCMRNVRLEDATPEEAGVIDTLVATSVSPGGAPASAAAPLPTPLLVAVGAIAVLGAVSFLAFRRQGPSDLA